MKLTLNFLEFVRKISEALASELQQLVTRLNTWGAVEHHGDGRHKFALTPIPYRASSFTGNNAMTWTVTAAQIKKLYWRQIDSVVTLWVQIDASTAGGVASTALRLMVPPAIAAAKQSYGVGHGVDNATGISIVGILTGTQLQIFRTDFAAWTAGTVSVRLTMDYEGV